jgi:hypothetical protein
VAWLMSLQADFALAPLACSGEGKSGLYVVLAIAFLLCAGGGIMGTAAWRSPVPHETNGIAPRPQIHRGLALATVGISALSILLILAQTIPTVLFTGCE